MANRDRHAVAPRWNPQLAILATAGFFLILGWLQKAPCLRGNVNAEGQAHLDWSGRPQYTAACYSDQIPLFGGRGLDTLTVPYFQSITTDGVERWMEYPVLSGFYQFLAAALARPVHAAWDSLGLPPVPASVVFFAVSSIGLALCWLIGVALLTRLTGARTWDAMLMAASPLVIVHAFTNFDLLSIVFAVGCLAAWANHKPLLAGVLGGLGVAAKLWPAFILGALLLLCLKTRAWRELGRMLGGAIGSWALLNAPVMIAAPRGWGEFFRLNSVRGYEGSTIYAVIAHITGREAWDGGSPSKAIEGVETLNYITTGLLLVALVALGWFVVFYLKTTPRVAQVAFLAVLAFLLTNKVWSPQYSIWLVPLIALALPRWRLYFIWATIEAGYWYLRMWQFLPAEEAAPNWLVDSVTVLRLGLLIAMAVIVIRDMLQTDGRLTAPGRQRDLVRAAHSGADPLAGILAAKEPGARRLTSEKEIGATTAKKQPAGKNHSEAAPATD